METTQLKHLTLDSVIVSSPPHRPPQYHSYAADLLRLYSFLVELYNRSLRTIPVQSGHS
jgi:hypothetical protein